MQPMFAMKLENLYIPDLDWKTKFWKNPTISKKVYTKCKKGLIYTTLRKIHKALF